MKLNLKDKDFSHKLPQSPGVYRFYDKDNGLLYVGKAINIKNRVKNYFQKQKTISPRISVMVQKISMVEITITENEISALILENNLIKELKPKYNIIFRDDKTYPLIRITNHKFPKIDYYRGKISNVDKYFGPYPNAIATKQVIDTIQRIFKIRTCSDNFFNTRTRPCILHQIKRCTGPCVMLIKEDKYNQQIKSTIDFLKGHYSFLLKKLTREMNIYAKNMEFEAAAATRDEITSIKQIQTNQIITTHNQPLNADLITYKFISHTLYIYLIIVRNGMYIGDNHYIIKVKDEDYTSFIEIFLENYYLIERNTQLILINCQLSSDFITFFKSALHIDISSSITGTAKQLLNMGEINLEKIVGSMSSTDNISQAISSLAVLLGNHTINRIECIDISHHNGENTVGSIVVFDNNKLDHSQYRQYNLPQETKGNDLLAIQTILKQRFSQIETSTPSMILVDGGKAQFKIVKNIITQHNLYGKIKVVAIFKGKRRNPQLDKIIVDDGQVISYQDHVSIFRVLQQLRDEAHRFAITGHRNKQIKKMSNSEISNIPNIGIKKRKELFLHFGSLKAIAKASMSELQEVNGIGASLAGQIYSYFH